MLPSRREGLSNALLEAMAARLPCIAYDIPPNREVLADGGTGLLVPVEDRGALATAMIRMAGDVEYAHFLATAGHARIVAQYSMPSVVAAYSSLYHLLAGASAKA